MAPAVGEDWLEFKTMSCKRFCDIGGGQLQMNAVLDVRHENIRKVDDDETRAMTHGGRWQYGVRGRPPA